MKHELEKQAAKLEKELAILRGQIAALPAEDPYKKFKDALAAGHIVAYVESSGRYSNDPSEFCWNASPDKYMIIEMPEGYHFWAGGENPCHPKDIIAYITRDGQRAERENRESREYRWSKNFTDGDIIAYKVVKKYVEPPRPMTFRDIPVGTVFTYRSTWRKAASDFFLKLSNEKDKNTFNLSNKHLTWFELDSAEGVEFFTARACFERTNQLMSSWW